MKLENIKDWAIFARAKDSMIDTDIAEEDAIDMAIEEEADDFRYAMSQIKAGNISRIEAVQIGEDGTFMIEDDFYTDEHMAEITDALTKAIEEAKADTYEEEVTYSWYHRD